MIEQLLSIGATAPRPINAFLGEVPTSEFITGETLVTSLGITNGIAINSNEPWLHFELDGKTLYVAKKPYRRNISWGQINTRGAVFGTATVVINGLTYKVRLLKGANSDPFSTPTGTDDPGTWGSEWNRLFYPLIPNPTNKPASGISGEGIVFGSWANYTETELTMGSSGGMGRGSWGQETAGVNAIIRGSSGVTYVGSIDSNTTHANYGWRPCLELAE